MSSRPSLSLGLLALSLCACGGGSSRGGADPSMEPLTTAVVVEEGDRVDTQRSDHEQARTVVAPQPLAAPTMQIVRIGAGDAEDGAGHVVRAADRVAIDLDAGAFPPRALDPVLIVGTGRFVHYSHPHAGVLRFVADDASRLQRGAEVSIQYGDDVSSRRVVRQALTDADLEISRP